MTNNNDGAHQFNSEAKALQYVARNLNGYTEVNRNQPLQSRQYSISSGTNNPNNFEGSAIFTVSFKN